MKKCQRIGIRLAIGMVLFAAASVANATVFIGLQQDAGPIVTVASNPTGTAVFSGSFGQFEGITFAGSGQPNLTLPLLMQSAGELINNAGANNAGTLTVYVSSTGNTERPSLTQQFMSGFATISFSGWSQTMSTYVDPGNGVYALNRQLGSATFTNVDSKVDGSIQDVGAGPYALTTVYSFSAPSLGGVSSAVGVSVAPVPEPEIYTMMGVGLALVGWAARRRKGQVA